MRSPKGTDPMPLLIGQFNDSYLPVTDGVVTVVRNYTYWLNQKYGKCMLFAPTRNKQSFDEEFDVVGYRSFALPKRPPYRVGMPAIDGVYRRKVDTLPFDLVHTHSPFSSGSEALRIARRRNIPIVATFHSKFYDDFFEYTRSKTLAKTGVDIVVHFFNKVSSVWTVSESTVETLRSYGYKGDITVIPNGTDFSMPDDVAAAKRRADEFCGIGDNRPLFLFVGQHIWQKNIRLIAQAAQKLRQTDPGFLLLMVGDGVARQELQEWTEEQGLQRCIRFAGVVRDRELLSSLYLRANAFVFPSIYDNAPCVVKEASAMACPTITVQGCNAAQGMTDGVNGILCENTLDSLCEKMHFVLSHPDQAAQIGRMAQKTLAPSWESIVDRAYEEYVRLLWKFTPERAKELGL